MKPRSIAAALAFCVSLVSTPVVSTSFAKEQGNVIRIDLPVVKQLRLTPMQERRLVPVLRAERLEIQAIKNDQSLSKSQQLRRLRAVQNRSNRKLRVILTRSQFRQLQVNRQQRAQLTAAVMQTTKTHDTASRMK